MADGKEAIKCMVKEGIISTDPHVKTGNAEYLNYYDEFTCEVIKKRHFTVKTDW